MSQKIVFMGTPEFSIPSLESLVKSDNKILAVYSQSAKKADRGQKKKLSPVEVFAKKNSINVRTPEILNTEDEYNFMKELKPDFVVVVAYGKIIPERFLSLSKYGFINVHASLLPKWRGAAPIQRSIMNLDKETGISIMKIVKELDSGPIISQSKVNINENINTGTLTKVLSQLGAKALIDSINNLKTNQAKFKDQDHSKATYADKIKKIEAKINWNDDAKKILAKINGLNPAPGAWFEFKKERFKVWRAKIENFQGKSGIVVNDKLTIACQDRSIQILEIQKEGKSRLSSEDFLIGNQIKKNEIIN